MAEHTRLQEDLRKVRRSKIASWIFVIVGVILVGFGYTLYDSGIRYSGIFMITMGMASVGFGFILGRYSRKII